MNEQWVVARGWGFRHGKCCSVGETVGRTDNKMLKGELLVEPGEFQAGDRGRRDSFESCSPAKIGGRNVEGHFVPIGVDLDADGNVVSRLFDGVLDEPEIAAFDPFFLQTVGDNDHKFALIECYGLCAAEGCSPDSVTDLCPDTFGACCP